MPYSKVSLTYLDYDNEKSVVEFKGVQMTAGNFDAQVGLQDALSTAVAGITVGNLHKTARVSSIVDGEAFGPANSAAMRESKWLCVYSDNVTHKMYSVSVPCADPDVLPARNPGDKSPEVLPLDAGPGLAFKTAFEAYVTAGEAMTHAVTLHSVTRVSRNT